MISFSSTLVVPAPVDESDELTGLVSGVRVPSGPRTSVLVEGEEEIIHPIYKVLHGCERIVRVLFLHHVEQTLVRASSSLLKRISIITFYNDI